LVINESSLIIVHHHHHHHRSDIFVQTFCSIAGISDNDFADGNSKVADKGKGAGAGAGKGAAVLAQAIRARSAGHRDATFPDVFEE